MTQSFLGRLFRRTSVDAMRARTDASPLKRALRGRDLIAIGLGTMIGGGIFTTIGPGVHKAGPAVVLAFMLAGFASLLAALCYAELGAVIPSAGSAYTFAYATLGQVVGWIIGWNLILEYAISAAPVSQQFSQSLQEAVHALIGARLPPVLSKAVLAHDGSWWQIDWSHSSIDLIGALFVLLLTVLIVIGIRETARTNNTLVVIKVTALLAFILTGLALFHPQNLTPFNPIGWVGPLDKDAIPTGIFGGAALVFFTYIGFDTATTTSEECVNPPRDIPVGVIGSLLIGTLLYCAVAIVLVGAVPWQQVNVDTPLQSALAPLHLPWAEWIIRIGVLAGTASVALISLLGQSRIFFAMARDNMLPPAVAEINPRFHTPARMSIITGLVVAAFTLIVPLDLLLSLVNIGTMSAFIAVCLGVLVMRVKRPDIPRPFRTPFVWFTAIGGVVITAMLAVLGLGMITFAWFGAWLLVGLVFYFAYGFRKAGREL
ncbi:MAG: basic amino acid/polyamine antiporter, family [Candidatus Eremiobacteraeota bacterium]|jgi:APA family basic amino acid/polyamine antiporter|nr:basic amino acid/polyamine antiporter, family [Candidatus Eremiobacteraeota bacterium]